MSAYTVRSLPRDVPFADYEYEILRDGVKVAKFSHDYRGEDVQMRTEAGWRYCEYILEGGPPPDAVSEAGARLLDAILAETPGPG
jgi:hypothetical protein